MSGKKKCRILKEIRQKIADENDIPFVTHECRYQGKCSGTCPRCESELAYLEKQLAARAAAGKKIAVAALCAGMTFSVAGCSSLIPEKEPEEVTDLSGMIAEPEPEGTIPMSKVRKTGIQRMRSLNCPEKSRIRMTRITRTRRKLQLQQTHARPQVPMQQNKSFL